MWSGHVCAEREWSKGTRDCGGCFGTLQWGSRVELGVKRVDSAERCKFEYITTISHK